MTKFKFYDIIGFVFAIALVLVAGSLYFTADTSDRQNSNFEIVDTYKGCDVVRYTSPQLANYHFFLDCYHQSDKE